FVPTPRPPRPPLFPYTTLFRSRHSVTPRAPQAVRCYQTADGAHGVRALPLWSAACFYFPSSKNGGEMSESFSPLFEQDSVRLLGDRKSTRLNSSHVAISYAVFC